MFALGVLAGVLGTGVYFERTHLKMLNRPETKTAFIVKKLTDRLDLTAEQEDKIDLIVKEMQTEIRTRFPVPRREIRNVLEAGFDRIRLLLTPTQQAKMDRIRQDFEQKRRRMDKMENAP